MLPYALAAISIFVTNKMTKIWYLCYKKVAVITEHLGFWTTSGDCEFETHWMQNRPSTMLANRNALQ